MSSPPDPGDRVESLRRLDWFREEFDACLPRRSGALFELTEVGCALTAWYRAWSG